MRLPEAPAPGDYPLHPTAATYRVCPFPKEAHSRPTYRRPPWLLPSSHFLYHRSQQRASPLAL
eukprot:3783651-Pleurochrysis_carterae.AAC.1